MKHCIAAAVVLSCAAVALAQQVRPEPDFSDVFYRLEANRLVSLERQTVTQQAKASGFVVMNVKAVSEIAGARASVRFPAGQPLDFVVRTAFDPSALDPGAVYFLRRLTVKKNDRELLMMSAHLSPVGSSRTSGQADALPVAFSRYGTSSLEITTQRLAPGEYALREDHANAVFCFGVD